MKLNTQTSEVLTNTCASQSMAVDDSEAALFFQIMSSQIYQYKIRAVVRELFCNAVDSHSDAKTDEKIIVKFPNKLEPWFSVEDFGLGMSDTFINEVYRKALKSTKRDSDNIGGFGVGKLAPLSYVDQFTLESVYEGTHTIYSIYKNSQGVPDVSVITSFPTGSCNGVKVKVPAQEEDFKEFDTEIRSILRWFDESKFKTVGSDKPAEGFNFEWKNDYVIVPDDDRKLKNSVIVGGVAYPIPDGIDFGDLGKVATGIYQPKLAIKMEVNDVEVSVSRESLSFTPKTKRAIQCKVDTINKFFVDDLQETLDKMPSTKELYKIDHKRIYWALTDKLKCKGKYLAEYHKKFKVEQQPETLKYCLQKGYVRVNAKRQDLDMTPLDRPVKLLVIDQKHHIQHNRNEWTTTDAYCFQVEPQDLDSTKELFSDYEVSVEYLSERVAAGCRPPKREIIASSQREKGCDYHVIVDGIYYTERGKREDLKETYKDLINKGKVVYVHSMTFKSKRAVQDILTVSQYLPESVSVLLVNIPTGNWISKELGIPAMYNMEWSDTDKDKALQLSYWNQKYLSWPSESTLNFIKSLSEICPLLLEGLSDKVKDAVEGEYSYVSSTLDTTLFKAFEDYSTEDPWKDLDKDLEPLYKKFEEEFPLLNIRSVYREDVEEYSWYINMKRNKEFKNAA